MDTVRLHLDIQNSLVNTLKETQKVMTGLNSVIDKAAVKFESISNTGEVINDNYNEIEESAENVTTSTNLWNRALQKTRDVVSRIGGPIASIFSISTIIDATKNVFEHIQATRDLSYRMGEAGKTAGFFRDTIYDVAKSTGISTDRALELVGGLRRLRVATQDIAELAKQTEMFSEVTGVSTTTSIRLAGELVRTGRVTSKVAAGMLTDIAKVQRAFGLTENEVEGLSEALIYTTRVLGQFGKSADFIAEFNDGVIELAGAFASVGIDASEANRFVEELLDPGKIEDNALLYSRLGISIQDVVSGNVDIASLAPKFKSLGQELTSMSGPAASAMAKSMGKPLEILRAMAGIDLSKIGETGEDSAKTMQDMYEEQLGPLARAEKALENVRTTIQETISIAANKIQGIIKSITGILSNKALWIAGGIGLLLLISKIRGRFLAVATDFGKAVSTAMTESLDMAAKKSGVISERRGATGGRRGREDIQARIIAGDEYKRIQGVATTFEVMSQGNLFPAVAKMTENTAQWLRTISMGSEKVSLLGILTEQRNKKMRESLDFHRQENLMVNQRVKQVLEEDAIRHKGLSGRITELETMQRTAEQEWELNRLLKERSAVDRDIEQNNKMINQQNNIFEDTTKRIIQLMSGGEAKALYGNLVTQKQRLESGMMHHEIRRSELETSIEILNRERDILEASKNTLEAKIGTEEWTSDEAIKLQEIKKHLTDVSDEHKIITTNLSEENTAFKTQADEAKKIVTQMGLIERSIEKTGEEILKIDTGALQVSRWKRMTDFIGATFRSAGTTMVDAFDKAKKSALQIGMNIVEKLKPQNWLKSIMAKVRGYGEEEGAKTRTAMGGLMGGLKNLGGNILRIAGPLALLGMLMKPLQPIIQQMGDILSSALAPLLDVLVKALLPPIMRVFAALLPLIGILVTKLLPPLLRVLGWVVKGLSLFIEGLSRIFKGLKGAADSIKGVGDGLISAADSININEKEIMASMFDAQKKVIAAADNIAKNGMQALKSMEEVATTAIDAQKEVALAGMEEPTIITAGAGGRLTVQERTAANEEINIKLGIIADATQQTSKNTGEGGALDNSFNFNMDEIRKSNKETVLTLANGLQLKIGTEDKKYKTAEDLTPYK